MVISKEKKAVMKRTPRFDLHENSIQRRWSIQMDSTGRANGFVNISLKGVQAQDMRYLLNRASSKDMENWLGRELLSRFPMSELDSMDIRGQNDLIQPLEISGTFSNAVLADREGDICSFQPGSICSYDWNRLFPEQERKYRIELKYPLEISDIAEIRIPKNFKINTLDVKDSLVTHYGSYFYNIGFDSQNRLTYQRRFQVDSTTIDLKQFSNFRWFLNQVAMKDKKTVLLYR
jgi:hypothetical protein